MIDDRDGESQERMYLPHPHRVAAGKIIAHGNDVHALARESIQIGRKRGDQGFSFAGFHLSDRTAVQYRAAYELYIEMTLSQGPLRRFPHDRKRLRKELVETFAFREPFPEFRGFRPERGVGELRDLLLAGIDRGNERGGFFQEHVALFADEISPRKHRGIVYKEKKK